MPYLDSLESKAGIRNLIECHGSFAFLECIHCKRRYETKDYSNDIVDGRVPTCPKCNKVKYKHKPKRRRLKRKSYDDLDNYDDDDITLPYLKTFFGEDVNSDYEHLILEDSQKVDLVIVMGTSLSVAPMSEFICMLLTSN